MEEKKEQTATQNRHPVETGNAFSKDYKQVLEDINREGLCPAPFCIDEAPYHKHPIILNFNYWKVTRNSFNYQNAKHAFLIILKRHEEDFMKITLPEITDLWFVIRTLVADYNLRGYSLVWRMGEQSYTGASVNHLHAHLICGTPKPDKPSSELSDEELIKAVIGFA